MVIFNAKLRKIPDTVVVPGIFTVMKKSRLGQRLIRTEQSLLKNGSVSDGADGETEVDGIGLGIHFPGGFDGHIAGFTTGGARISGPIYTK